MNCNKNKSVAFFQFMASRRESMHAMQLVGRARCTHFLFSFIETDGRRQYAPLIYLVFQVLLNDVSSSFPLALKDYFLYTHTYHIYVS